PDDYAPNEKSKEEYKPKGDDKPTDEYKGENTHTKTDEEYKPEGHPQPEYPEAQPYSNVGKTPYHES
ncbi:hypothetical protein K7432_012762, partial [Basidiobolus ranarum]